jgi:RimK-like ATP-grasp domain
MPSNIKIYSYSSKSKSAKALANELDATMITRKSSYIPSHDDKVINWGCSTTPSWWKGSYLNKPSAIGRACSKLATLGTLKQHDVRTVEWSEYWTQALDWLEDGFLVYARTKLSGHSGKGIVIMNNVYGFVPAPLYTKFLGHDREFRIHVLKGTVMDAVEKKQRDSDIPADMYIRSNKRGWKFNRKVIIPQDVLDQAVKAVKALCLDFGAVDVGYKSDENKAYVFEVNTACGLEGTTLIKYTEAFKKAIYD